MVNSRNVVFMLWLVFAPLGLYYIINTWAMTPDTVGYQAALFFGNVMMYYLWIYAFVSNLRSIMYQEVMTEVMKDAYDDIREQVEQELQVVQDEPSDEEKPESSDEPEIPIVEPVEIAASNDQVEDQSEDESEDESEDGNMAALKDAQAALTASPDSVSIAVPL